MNDIGLIGIGVMGRSLALNMENKGYKVSVYNHTPKYTASFIENAAKDRNISGFYDIESFVNSLCKPRKIIMMITAGEPVDVMIKELLPCLDRGDLIMDGGNTYFHDTTRRIEELSKKGILYLGVGVSGGEAGALKGPSLMPGGSREAYNLVKDILLSIAAQTDGGACCTYVGNGAAGHFVKMLHNGIEYAMMQAMSEVYDILRRVLGLSSQEIGNIFEEWNRGELNSYLMEIAYKIMGHRDDETGKPTVEIILDKAGQKGTGKWTAQTSLELGIPAPSLTAAVEGRVISFFKGERTKLSKLFNSEYPEAKYDKEKLINDLKNSLLFANFIIFSQGLWLIAEASREYKFEIDLSEILRIWRGGCIIRAKMLDDLREIIEEDKENVILLNSKRSMEFLTDKLEAVKYVTNMAKDFCIPVLVLNTAVDYFFSMVSENLPANFIQAQRDFFGAHTYSRIDKEGIFHTPNWE